MNMIDQIENVIGYYFVTAHYGEHKLNFAIPLASDSFKEKHGLLTMAKYQLYLRLYSKVHYAPSYKILHPKFVVPKPINDFPGLK